MAGQAGVWMLLVLLPCLCTSTIRANFFSRDNAGGVFPSASYDCCRKSLTQGEALIAGQGQIQQILFDNRNIIFEKVNDDIQSIKNDTSTVLENQAVSQGLISRCQAQVLTNISIVQDSQGALQENMTKFQDFVMNGIDKVEQLQRETFQELRDARAGIKRRVRSEHNATRELVTQTGNAVQSTLGELRGILEKVHASIEVLTEIVQSCCRRGQGKIHPSARIKDPFFMY